MKAKIDNKIVEVEIINKDYNDHAAEVKILEGMFKGRLCIVEHKDLISEIKKKKYKMSDVTYHKGEKMFMGKVSSIWAARIGIITLASNCGTKAEAIKEARLEIKKMNRLENSNENI